MSPDVTVSLPIRSVTLTEDRGVVSRRGRLDWPGGARAIVIRPVAPVLVDASLQCIVHDGDLQVARIAAQRQWTRRPLDGDAPAAVAARAEQLNQTLHDLTQTLRRHQTQRARAFSLLHRYAEQISWAATRGEADLERWHHDLNRLEGVLFDALELEIAQSDAVHDAREALTALQLARTRLEERWQMTASIELLLDGPAGAAALEVRYLVPSAMWRPSYRARMDGPDAVELTALATVWQRTGEGWSDVALSLSTARPAAGAALPPLHYDRLSLREKSAEERRVIQAHFHEQSIEKTDLTHGDSAQALPGVDDGGEVQRRSARMPIDVPSDGRPRQVAVDRLRATVTPRYLCVPERKALVFASVDLTNTLTAPLLAGPVTLIQDGGPAGVGAVPFVAPGQPFTLSLGSQDDVSVTYTRRAEVERRMALTDRRWLVQTVELVSTGAALSVDVVLRVPVSELAQVRVVVDREKRSSPNMAGPDADGHARWTVALTPNRPETRTLAFRLDRDSNVQLPDPW
ncbi:MAG: mucoidy inhibitor MuiA family protein [Myxococcota bacterium]